MLENGADTRYIQALLGHSDLSSTQIYTHVAIHKLKEIHAATHPAKLERGERGQNDAKGEAISEREALFSTLAAEADEEDEDLDEPAPQRFLRRQRSPKIEGEESA